MSKLSFSTSNWRQTRFLQSVAQAEQFPLIDLPQVGVVGHSNVGKSSLLNALFASRSMVKTAKNPGCTRLLNLFEVDERFVLVDLPGYGFAKVSKKEQKRWALLIQDYLSSAMRPCCVLMLMDIRHGPKDSDLQLIEWLNEIGLRWLPIATKADKLSGNQRTKRLQEMTHALGGLLAPLPVSSLKGTGIDKLRQQISYELKRAAY